jgi:hypothetical protein
MGLKKKDLWVYYIRESACIFKTEGNNPSAEYI